MVVEIAVTGNGHYAGSRSSLESYEVQEDATPLAGDDTAGGVGQLTFNVTEDRSAEGTILLLNDVITLSDGTRGTTVGTVSAVGSNNWLATVTADSRLGILVAERQAKPFVGTLEAAFRYYLGLANLTTAIVVDDAIKARPVTYPGWFGTIWDFLKQLCIAEGVEISLVSNQIVLRPIRKNLIDTTRFSDESWNVNNGQLARAVEVCYYENTWRTNALVYPKGGWQEDVEVYQVDAGERREVQIPLEISLSSIQQPNPIDYVDADYTGPSSVYAITGNDGLPIGAGRWTANGGKITVAINEDTKSLTLTIYGSTETKYAPYRIGVSSGPSDTYSSLRLVGTGVFFEQKSIVVGTGVPFDRTAQEIGAKVENPAITNISQAYDVALRTAIRWGTPAQTVSINASAVNRRGETGSYRYPLLSEMDTYNTGKTLDQLDAEWLNHTITEVDKFWKDRAASDFANQAFGNIAGARLPYRQAMYRVRSATINPSGISMQAEADTTVNDFDAKWKGKTLDAFDAQWAGKTMDEFGLIPLWQK